MPTKLTARYRMNWIPEQRRGDFISPNGYPLANFFWDDYGIRLDLPRKALKTSKERPLWYTMYQDIAYMIKTEGL